MVPLWLAVIVVTASCMAAIVLSAYMVNWAHKIAEATVREAAQRTRKLTPLPHTTTDLTDAIVIHDQWTRVVAAIDAIVPPNIQRNYSQQTRALREVLGLCQLAYDLGAVHAHDYNPKTPDKYDSAPRTAMFGNANAEPPRRSSFDAPIADDLLAALRIDAAEQGVTVEELIARIIGADIVDKLADDLAVEHDALEEPEADTAEPEEPESEPFTFDAEPVTRAGVVVDPTNGLWTCPVCHNTNQPGAICPECGYVRPRPAQEDSPARRAMRPRQSAPATADEDDDFYE